MATAGGVAAQHQHRDAGGHEDEWQHGHDVHRSPFAIRS